MSTLQQHQVRSRLEALRATGYAGPAYLRGRPAYEWIVHMQRTPRRQTERRAA